MDEVVTDAQMWAMIVGFVSPLLIAMVQQPRWRKEARVGVTLLWSLLAGAGTAWFAGEFDGRGIVSSVLLVIVTALVTYQNLWKPTRIAPIIEAKTSGGAYVITDVQRGPKVLDSHEKPQG